MASVAEDNILQVSRGGAGPGHVLVIILQVSRGGAGPGHVLVM